jgi:transposase
MEHVKGKSREQIELRCLNDMVETDSPARQIDMIVDKMDTSYFEKAAPKETGRPPFNPKDMLKLYIYGMDNGIVSSRKLERETKRNIEVMWLINGLRPENTTICNFRRENAVNLVRFFNEFSVALADAGYIEGKIVAIDGTKIRANNSKRNNFSAKKLDRHIEYLDKRIAEYMGELDKNDKIDELKERKGKYISFKRRIESGEVTEVSTTDPDSRLMKQGNNGVDVSYNVQAAVDSKNKLFAGFLVTNEPNDQGQLHKVAKSVKDNLSLDKMIVPADKGYYDTDDIKKCHDDKITTLVSKPDAPKESKEFFKKCDFKYSPEEDIYICPAGNKLKGGKPDKNGYKRYRNSKACHHCPIKHKCTVGYRKDLGRHQYAGVAEKNDLDFANNQDIYRQRQLLCEHPFGTVKRTMGIRQFLMRGLINVNAEAALIFLAYNLKRLRTIHKESDKKDGQVLFSLLLPIFFMFFFVA